MDAVLLARLQFALTAGFHFIFPPITIGLAWLIVGIMNRYRRTGDALHGELARFWIRIFGLTFAVGVATGIVMEFQFGMNWAPYSRFVGDIFGAPLAAEGILAFFLESTFVAVLLFGWQRASRRTLWFSALMVAVGSTLSAFWIIAANSWQQTPAGFAIVDGRAVLTDFWAAVFNPSTVPRYLHTVAASLVCGAFFMLGLNAWIARRAGPSEKLLVGTRMALIMGLCGALAMVFTGHAHAVQVARTQPEKLAAIEGLFDTQSRAPALLFGVPAADEERMRFRVEIPGALSLLAGGDPDAVIQGLRDFPRDERPPLALTFYPFHAMVYLGGLFILYPVAGLWLLRRGRILASRRFLGLAIGMLPLPVLACELGWISAEVGRQPWSVYRLLRTSDSVSPLVPAGQVLASIVIFAAVYALLFAAWVFVLRRELLREAMSGSGGKGTPS